MSNNKLSFADIAYARKIICHNEIDQLFMLLYVLSEEKIYVYVVRRIGICNEIRTEKDY